MARSRQSTRKPAAKQPAKRSAAKQRPTKQPARKPAAKQRAARRPTKKPPSAKQRPSKRTTPARRELDAASRVELEAAIALVAVSPKRAATAGKKLASRLGPRGEAIDVLDAIADACLGVAPEWAVAAFWDARALGRALGIPAPLDRYRPFAAKGALDQRELVHLVELEGSASILIDAVAHGVTASSELVDALIDRDEELARTVLRGWLAAGLLAKIELDVWLAAGSVLGDALDADARGVLLAALLANKPTENLPLIAELGLAASATPEQAAALGDAVFRKESISRETAAIAATILDGIRGRVTRPLVVAEESPHDLRGRNLCDPVLIELALARGLPLAEPPGPPEQYSMYLYNWPGRGLPEDQLVEVGRHPWFSRALVQSFAPHNGSTVWFAEALRCSGCACVFEALARWAGAIAETWTVGALDVHGTWLEATAQTAVLARVPQLADAIRSLDPARLLANQLRAGIMDEWGWPALDEVAGFAEPRRAWTWGGPFPYKAYFEPGRLVVVGPERIELDTAYNHPSGQTAIRHVWWIGGDALAVSWGPEIAHWVIDGGEPFPYAGSFYTVPAGDAAITNRHVLFRRGERELPHDSRRSGYRMWSDGTTFYGAPQELVIRRDGASWKSRLVDEKYPYTFDPKTGETTGCAVPAWMAALVPGEGDALVVHIQATNMQPVPPGAEQSPLGVKDGLGGFAVVSRGGELSGERIDGRRGPGIIGNLFVADLMTFPERPGLYPLVQAAFDIGVTMPDGVTPLIPTGELDGPSYWGGSLGFDELPYFYLLRPRDPAASRALARCSDDAARAIYDAALATETTPEQVKDYGNMQAVLVSAPVATASTPALREAIVHALPEVTHPRMIEGIAALAAVARKLEVTCDRLRSQLDVPADGPSSTLTNADAAAVSTLLDHARPWWTESLGTQLGQQILDVDSFLFGTATSPVTPARTVVPWELVMTRIGELLYRLLAPGTPRSMRDGLGDFLELWRTTKLAAHPERVRLVSFAMPLPCPELAGLDRAHPDRLLAWGNRYFVRSAGIQHGHEVVRGLEVSPDGVFRLPPGATLVEERATDRRFSPAAIEAALRLLDSRGPLPFDPSIATQLATATGLGTPAATLVWAGGYEPWLAGSAVQRALGVTHEHLALAEIELRGKRLRELYADAMTEDPSAAYTAAIVPRLAAAWTARFGATTELPVELLAAMRADLASEKLPLESDARTLLDPDRATVLTIDAPWVMRPAPKFDAGARRFHGTLPNGWPVPRSGDHDGAADSDERFHGYAMTRFVRYVAWAHLALPGGDPARTGAARVANLLHARLANPELLVLAALVDLTTFDNVVVGTTPARDAAALFASIRARFAGIPYIAADGGPAGAGFDRGDAVVTWPAEENGLFIAFRPHRLADDVALARFLDDVGARADYDRTQGAAPISVDFPGASIIEPAGFGHWLTWRAPGFQRLVAALHAPLPAGRFAADPRTSAPAAVAGLRAAHGIDEATATLRLQQLVLPSTEPARIARFNGWTIAEHDRAARALLSRAFPAPDPRAVHGLAITDQPTFGVLLPLRPLAELFADALRFDAAPRNVPA